MRIAFLGAPGSGKGTQAKRLWADFSMVQISTGDLLRGAVSSGSDLGRQAQTAMNAGQLVSDEIVLGIIRDRLQSGDVDQGFILDGFPRNLAQAEALEGVLSDIDQPLDVVILLEVDFDILMKRLTGRRTCSKTGKLLNIYFSAPSEIDECLANGGQLIQRDDDNEETIGNRLTVYRQQTEPLVNYYRNAGLLRIVDGEGEVDEVYRRLTHMLDLTV
jgi:adenylate kinase